VHIEVEQLQELIVAGGVWPGDEPEVEQRRQLDLTTHNACLLARSFVEAGFDVALDHVVVTKQRLDDYRRRLTGIPLYLAVLSPGRAAALARDREREKSKRHLEERGIGIAERWQNLEDELKAELGGAGFWVGNAKLTPVQTVDVMIANRERARITT
jgi:hypothetical protein